MRLDRDRITVDGVPIGREPLLHRVPVGLELVRRIGRLCVIAELFQPQVPAFVQKGRKVARLE